MLDPNTAEESQVELLRRIAVTDRQALAEFYDQIAGPLFSTATRILGDAHEAEEVVQDVFVQIWEKAGTFDAALGSPFHWAMRTIIWKLQMKPRFVQSWAPTCSIVVALAGSGWLIQRVWF